MISRGKRFIFIHIYKVAGSSVREALTPYADAPSDFALSLNDVSRRILNREIVDTRQLHVHATALEYRSLLGEKYNKFYKFAFVRNPFDWQVSLYHYMKQSPDHEYYNFINNISFNDYITWRCHEQPRFQIDFVADENQNAIVNYIGRAETIEEDFRKICASLRIEADLPHKNRSEHSHYAEYYSDKSQQLLVDTFRRDFEAFGYSTDIQDGSLHPMAFDLP